MSKCTQVELFREYGKATRGKFLWTDSELVDHIHILDCVIAYLNGRGDCTLIEKLFKGEQITLLDMKTERKNIR